MLKANHPSEKILTDKHPKAPVFAFFKYCETRALTPLVLPACQCSPCVSWSWLWELRSDNQWLPEKLGKKLPASPGAQQMSAQSGILSKYCQQFHQIRLFSPQISRLWVKLFPAYRVPCEQQTCERCSEWRVQHITAMIGMVGQLTDSPVMKSFANICLNFRFSQGEVAFSEYCTLRSVQTIVNHR